MALPPSNNYSNTGGCGSGGRVTMPEINLYNNNNRNAIGNNTRTPTRIMNAPIKNNSALSLTSQLFSVIKQATNQDEFPVWEAQTISDHLIAGLLYLKLYPTHLPAPIPVETTGGNGAAVGAKGVMQPYYPHFDDVLYEGRQDGRLVFYFHIHRVEGVGVINPTLRDFTKAQAAQRFSEWTGYPVKIVSDDTRPYLGIRIVVTVNTKQQQQSQAEVLSPSSPPPVSPTERANLDAATTSVNLPPVTPKKLARRLDFLDYVDLSDIINKQDEFEYYLGVALDGSLLRRSAYLLDHVLAAGAPNSGKSSLLITMLAHALYSEVRQPNRVRLVLVDRLGVTFNHVLFEGLPQLYRQRVLTDTEEILEMFNGLELIEAQRAKLFQDAKVQKLADFNHKMEQEKHPHLKQPIILVFIEESNELAESLKGKFTEPLKRIIKVCRKYGIYFINAGPSFKASTYDSDIVDSSTSKVVFGDFDSDTARVFNLGSLRLSEVVPGRGIFKFAGRAQEFQSLYLEEQTFMAVVNMLRQQAGIEVMDTSPDLEAIRNRLESSEFTATSPFKIVGGGGAATKTGKEAGLGVRNTSETGTGTGTGTSFERPEQSGNRLEQAVPTLEQTGTKLGQSGNTQQTSLGTNSYWKQNGNTGGNLFPELGTQEFVPGTREQIPASEFSSAPVPPQTQENSRSHFVPAVELDALKVAEIVAMLMAGNGNKTEIIKAISKASGLSYGRNYQVLVAYYEQLVASVTTNFNAAAHSNRSDTSPGTRKQVPYQPQQLAAADDTKHAATCLNTTVGSSNHHFSNSNFNSNSDGGNEYGGGSSSRRDMHDGKRLIKSNNNNQVADATATFRFTNAITPSTAINNPPLISANITSGSSSRSNENSISSTLLQTTLPLRMTDDDSSSSNNKKNKSNSTAESLKVSVPTGTVQLSGITKYVYDAVLSADPEYGISTKELQQVLADTYNMRTPIKTIEAKLQMLQTSELIEAETEADEDGGDDYDYDNTRLTVYYYPSSVGVVVEANNLAQKKRA